MFFRKAVAGIAAVMLVASSAGMTAFAAGTDDAKEQSFTEAKMPVILYAPDQVTEIDCRFFENTPSIPYIKLSDFYECWSGDQLTVKALQDGVFEVTTPLEVTGSIDTEKDTIATDYRAAFYLPASDATGDNSLYDLFVKFDFENSKTVGGPESPGETLDLSKYHIDMIAGDNDVWVPAATLCDLFTTSTKIGGVVENMLVFGGSHVQPFSTVDVSATPQHADAFADANKESRPEDMAEFNYNELCFSFDRTYGFPGRPTYTDLMHEKGLDGMLSEANDTTKAIKQLLLSTDLMDYVTGFSALNYYLWDGGHTMFPDVPYFSSYISENIGPAQQKFYQSGLSFEGAADFIGDQNSVGMSADCAKAAREALFAQEGVKTEKLAYATYAEVGDIAFFSFDQFIMDIPGWTAYYQGDGEMPEDTASEFFYAVSKADANPEIKRFVVDLGTNIGGVTLTTQYIINMIAGLEQTSTADNIYGGISTTVYKIDKNFDKVIDEKDAAFKPDLEFGIITSNRSFSCGNWLPALAKENGIMLMGEQSGGGGCMVVHRMTADGLPYLLSNGACFVDKNGNSIDNGVEPDFTYDSLQPAEDGTKDFTPVYDPTNIDNCFNEFYRDSETTTTPIESTTTETTTTTTTSAIEVTTTSETSEEATTTTTTTTTTTENVAKQYFAPVEKLGGMAVKDYESKNSGAKVTSETIENEDGTVSVVLSDEKGNVVDTYTIDPVTGKGTDSKGGTVDLPQTGNNSVKTAAAAATALFLMLIGSAAVAGSGVLRKKDEE